MPSFEMEPVDHAFPESEYRERIKHARKAMRTAKVDCVVCVGPELLYYLAGYDAHTHFSQQGLVLGVQDDEPTLIIRDVDLGRAEVGSWLKDVRLYRHVADDPAKLVAQAVKDKAPVGMRVGADLRAYALTGAYAFNLTEQLAPAALVDASEWLDELRLVKSEREMVYVRKAAEYATTGLERAREVIRPGITEIELAGQIESVMRAAGSEYPAMPCWINSGPRRGGHKTPDHRTIKQGDNIAMEFAGVHRRYHAVTIQTVAVGEAAPGFRRTYNLALEALREGSKTIAANTPVCQSEQAVVDALVKGGADPSIRARFGYGVAIAYPPTWLESLDITLESKQFFRPPMTFVLHTADTDEETGQGCLIGGAYALTESGLEILSGGDLELAVL